jgi:hypothetical protein
MRARREAGAHTYHSKSARNSQTADCMVPRPRKDSQVGRLEHEAFVCGLLAGLTIGLVLLAAVMWLWAIPTVDGCVQAMREVVANA